MGNEHQGIKDKGDGTHRWTIFLRGHDGRKGNSRDDFGIEKAARMALGCWSHWSAVLTGGVEAAS